MDTEGYNGPRETLFLSDNLIAVTTYNADLRIFNTDSKTLVKTINLDAKAEGMAIGNDFMLVCMPNIKDSYDANKTVAILQGK